MGNIINFEQKSTVKSQLYTESPISAGSTKTPLVMTSYLPSSAPLEKTDISEIKEQLLPSSTVISHYTTYSKNGATEDIKTQESVTQIEQIEVGPLVTSMEISKHFPSREFSVTETPFISTTMTPEFQTEEKTVSPFSESVTTRSNGLGEDDGEIGTFRSGQSTLVVSQMPEVITVSKISEDTTPTELEHLESVAASTIASLITMSDTDRSTISWEEEKTNGGVSENGLYQSVSSTPLPAHQTGVELLTYSQDKHLIGAKTTIVYPYLETTMTQETERTETETRDLKEEFMTTPFGLETSGYQDTTMYDEGTAAVHLTHHTQSVEVVTVSKWSWDEDNTTSKILGSTEYTDSPELSSASHTTMGISEKDKETPSFTEDRGEEFTQTPDSTQTLVEEHTEDVTGDLEKFTVSFQPTVSISITEKSTLSGATTEERGSPITRTEGHDYTTLEGSASSEGEDVDVSKPASTVPQFAYTSNGEGLAFVNYSGSTQEPTTYIDTSHTITLTVIPKTEWGPLVPSVSSEGEVLGEPSQDIRVIDQTRFESTISPKTLRTATEVLQGTDQEEQSPEITVPDFSLSTDTTQETTSSLDKADSTKSTYTVYEDSSVSATERVPSFETTSVEKIDQSTFYLPGTVTEQNGKIDEVVTLTPSMESKGSLSPGPEPTDDISPSPFSTTVTQFMEDTITEEKEKTSLDYVDLGSGFFEKPKVTEFPTSEATVPSDITTAFTLGDQLHTISALKPSSASTEKPPFIDREPGEETTSDIIIGKSTSYFSPTPFEDIATKETEGVVDTEYFTSSSTLVTQPTRPPTVDERETLRPQEVSTTESPTGTKLQPEINVYIIEVRENKTGKSLLSRHTNQGNQHFILKITLGQKINIQNAAFRRYLECENFLFLSFYILQELEEYVKQFRRMLDVVFNLKSIKKLCFVI